jgi:hypothetical protein
LPRAPAAPSEPAPHVASKRRFGGKKGRRLCLKQENSLIVHAFTFSWSELGPIRFECRPHSSESVGR